MGMIGDFLDIFKSSSKAVDTAADVVRMGAKGIDAIWYTAEEKAHDAAKAAEVKLKYSEIALTHREMSQNESSARSLSRRYLAWGSFALGGFLTVYALFFRTLAVFFPSLKDDLVAVAMFALSLLKIWWPVILAAATFYFSAALVRSWKSGS